MDNKQRIIDEALAIGFKRWTDDSEFFFIQKDLGGWLKIIVKMIDAPNACCFTVSVCIAGFFGRGGEDTLHMDYLYYDSEEKLTDFLNRLYGKVLNKMTTVFKGLAELQMMGM